MLVGKFSPWYEFPDWEGAGCVLQLYISTAYANPDSSEISIAYHSSAKLDLALSKRTSVEMSPTEKMFLPLLVESSRWVSSERGKEHLSIRKVTS